jgi:signal peptidase I
MARSDTARFRGKRKKQRSELVDTLLFLIKLAIFVALFRSFVLAPFSIPSQSMLPRLYIGDYLFVSKWNYGYSRNSLPWSVPLIPGRIFARTPHRGDVVVFKSPAPAHEDIIKRVIGLPGDTVQVRHGQVILNGTPVPRERVDDFVIPLSPNYDTRIPPGEDQPNCPPRFAGRDASGQAVCRYHQFRETLPDGRSYTVLDRGTYPDADDTQIFHVPTDSVFMMGDNRDDSGDSRFAVEDGGLGFVPMANLEGRALVTFWSTDGSAAWLKPWTWVSAARWRRIGHGF